MNLYVSSKCVQGQKCLKHPENQQNGAQNFLKSGNFMKILIPEYYAIHTKTLMTYIAELHCTVTALGLCKITVCPTLEFKHDVTSVSVDCENQASCHVHTVYMESQENIDVL